MRGIERYLSSLERVLRGVVATDRNRRKQPLPQTLGWTVERLLATRTRGAKVLAVGNGGSAAIASHLATDLIKAVGVRALVFTEGTLLTAYSNDDSYEAAFEEQVRRWAEPGDMLIAVSSSGRSVNILRAVAAAQEADATVVTLSGFAADNPLRRLGEVNLFAPGQTYGHVELAHAVLTHYLTDAACDRLASETAAEQASETEPTTEVSTSLRRARPLLVEGLP